MSDFISSQFQSTNHPGKPVPLHADDPLAKSVANQDIPLLVRALRGEPLPRPPVWLMRQAGRYLEEYRAIKAQSSFLEMCRTPELAFEVSMQPIRFFQPDAAIVFADILLPAQCLGIDVTFSPGPKVVNPIRAASDIHQLEIESPWSHLSAVMKTIEMLRAELESEAEALNKSAAQRTPRKAVLGFAGAPWTMACYLIDQGPFKHFEQTTIFAKQYPKAFETLLKHLSELTIEYLSAQLDAGADAVQLFESWGGMLSLDDYRRFALPSVQHILSSLRSKGHEVLYYLNGGAHLLDAVKESGATCLSVDSRTSLQSAYEALGPQAVVQGNLDPTDLFLPGDELFLKTRAMVESAKCFTGGSRYIANLGHGVLQTTPRQSVQAFIEAVKVGWS